MYIHTYKYIYIINYAGGTWGSSSWIAGETGPTR